MLGFYFHIVFLNAWVELENYAVYVLIFIHPFWIKCCLLTMILFLWLF